MVNLLFSISGAYFCILFWLHNQSYQMNPANYREALVEAQADESEGADILLVSIAVFVAD